MENRKQALEILERIALEKNLDPRSLRNALQDALISASRKMLGANVEITECEIDPETGEYKVYAMKEVVDEVVDPERQISINEVRQEIPDIMTGEELAIDVTPDDFGRIAAQSAKQVLTQRIREAEREMIYDKYKDRIGEMITGTVQRHERGNVIVDVGSCEAILPYKLQPYGERYRYGESVRAIIHDVPDVRTEPKARRDAQIVLSRTSPQLVVKLFEQEVAEMRDGVVTIRVIAREPGRRTKIAVMSRDSDVDPVGACVGMKGSRVQMVVQELRGERIDIIEYSDDKKRFVANSLKPAEIESVEMVSDESRALVVVRDDALSLAIGKGGLNARLASELTRVEIDILSESQLSEREESAKTTLLEQIPSLDDEMADRFISRGLLNYADILAAGEVAIKLVEGIEDDAAAEILAEAKAHQAQRGGGPAAKAPIEDESETDEEEFDESDEDVSDEDLDEDESDEEVEDVEEEVSDDDDDDEDAEESEMPVDPAAAEDES